MPVAPAIQNRVITSSESRGAVFTKFWVVDLLLDLACYSSKVNLVDTVAIEPAAGEGAFLIAMVRQLVTSCREQGRPMSDCLHSIIAYEIDDDSAEKARQAAVDSLLDMNVQANEAQNLANSWVRTGDYLIDAQQLPKADFVIGNPPYVRLENIPSSVADRYRTLHPTMKGRADLYIAFYEAALRQLKHGGVCAYICADRWMLNQYGAELRRFITSNFSVDVVVEMHDANAFEADVSAYPAITVIRNKRQKDAVVAHIGPSTEVTGTSFRAPSHNPNLRVATVDSWFSGSDPWPCGSPDRLKLLRRLEKDFLPLESKETETKVGIGVATGLDEFFITENGELVEKSRMLPLAMASDTLPGHLEWSEHFLVNPWNANGLVELEEYPRLHSYFTEHEAALRSRHTAMKNPVGWYRTIDRVNFGLIRKPKLYIPDIKNSLNPVLDTGSTYPHHNLYVISSDRWNLEVLGGILLSSVGQFFVECYGVRMRGGYLRFQAQYLRRIRVPHPASITQEQQDLLIKAFRNRDITLANTVAFQIYRIGEEEASSICMG
jgi:hypothetical protein